MASDTSPHFSTNLDRIIVPAILIFSSPLATELSAPLVIKCISTFHKTFILLLQPRTNDAQNYPSFFKMYRGLGQWTLSGFALYQSSRLSPFHCYQMPPYVAASTVKTHFERCFNTARSMTYATRIVIYLTNENSVQIDPSRIKLLTTYTEAGGNLTLVFSLDTISHIDQLRSAPFTLIRVKKQMITLELLHLVTVSADLSPCLAQ